ncbi:myb-like protein X [Senna tora]|uniref:Myb-like protein X n=1 Tax=Senna tora TaxID=362788 RepID=A0A834W360_9FABA|nr:myb-like protein X [Senna tora]
MSRCFPFPPPGYAKKTKTDDVDLLKKLGVLSRVCNQCCCVLILSVLFRKTGGLHQIGTRAVTIWESLANLENRLGFLDREMKGVKEDIGTIRGCLMDLHEVLTRLGKEEEMGKTKKDSLKWSPSWIKLENVNVPQVKRGEEEGRKELKNAPVLFGTEEIK